MGLLADVYSYGDSMKRKVRGLLSDPLGTIEQGIRNFGEDQNQMLQTMQNAYPIPGNKMANFTPAQIDSFRRQLADQATAQGMAGMTVWHGSPHKFDKFDSSKIGTGEGAQAYGHGLYLAESPDVATSYQKNLSGAMAVNGGEDAVRKLEKMLRDSADRAAKAGDKKQAAQFLQGADEQAAKLGQLYKVDLPDEQIAKMLDWDKPLSQQPEVTRALSRLGVPAPAEMTGGELIKSNYLKGLSDYNGVVMRGEDALRQKGIPGIRYLDGGSRGLGDGTSNFVIFPGNEGLLQILERNGAPL